MIQATRDTVAEVLRQLGYEVIIPDSPVFNYNESEIYIKTRAIGHVTSWDIAKDVIYDMKLNNASSEDCIIWLYAIEHLDAMADSALAVYKAKIRLAAYDKKQHKIVI